MMLSDIEALEIFVSLYSSGSVQKTADILGIEKSTVSRKMTKLENQLGRKLFDRSKRPFEILKDAHAIYSSIRKILEEKQKVEQYYRRLHDDQGMVIRVMIGNAHINFAPRLIVEYSKKFPNLHFNMLSPTDVFEFIAGKADIICLSNQAPLTGCVQIPRGRMIFVPVASPKYIKENGMIWHPSELSKHRCFSNLYADRNVLNINYTLTKKGEHISFLARDLIRFTNVEMAHRAVLEGYGVAICLPLFLCIDDLEAGRLVPVLDGWHRPSHPNIVACKEDDWKIRQIRMFATWWAKRLTEYEKDCENRLVKLYNRQFLENLLS